MEHSPYTPEGMIEGAGDFARGWKHTRGWRRVLGAVLLIAFPALIVLSLLVGLISAIW